jgi:energy-coupling factor transport system permease protein
LIILLSARIVHTSCGRENEVLRLSFWRFSLLVLSFSILFNLLLVHIGQTELVELPRSLPLIGGPLTLEAIVFGAASALVLITLLAVFLAFNSLVPTSDLISMAPRALANVGIVVLIAVSYVPETLKQLERIREAQALRGHQVGGLRDWRPILIPLLIGGLERSMSLAETMVARGYGATSNVSLSSWVRMALLAGLVLIFCGWLLSFWAPLPGWVLVFAGGALLVGLYIRQGRLFKRTKYQVAEWHMSDWILIGLSLVPLLLLLPLHGIDRTSLTYTPYPSVDFPPFDPVIGLALALLAAPAILTELDR